MIGKVGDIPGDDVGKLDCISHRPGFGQIVTHTMTRNGAPEQQPAWRKSATSLTCIEQRPPRLEWDNRATMRIPAFPFTIANWTEVEATTHAGETGVAHWRTLSFGHIRVRMVEYSPGYLADHWCEKGHVLLCLEGELHRQLRGHR